MLRFISQTFEKRISSYGLSLFRILFSLNLLFEVIRIYRYKELYFDPIPFIEQSSFNYSSVLLFWIFILILLILGLKTRIMTILSYIISLVVFSFTILSYHMYFVYVGVGFLMILMPVSNSLSLDVILNKDDYKDKTVSQFYYFITIFVGISLVYFDSIFFKFQSEVWTKGLGLWLPSSLPFMIVSNQEWFLNQEFLVKFFGYLTFAFEIVFPFIFFIKRLRVPLILVGVLLHVGICIQFPIPYFGYGVLAIYVLMVPVGFWDYLFANKIFNKKRSSIYNNNIKDINYSKKKQNVKLIYAWKAFVIILLFLQVNSTVNKQIKKLGFSSITSLSKIVERGSAKLFGITEHGVFIDSHFKGYSKIYTLSYNDQLLPLYDDVGMADYYLLGGSWVDFCFRVNKANVNKYNEELKVGLARYAAFWAYKNSVNLEDAKFKVLQRDIRVKFNWETNLLQNNLNQNWLEAGVLKWNKSGATVEINDLQ